MPRTSKKTKKSKTNIMLFLIGFVLGLVLTVWGGVYYYQNQDQLREQNLKRIIKKYVKRGEELERYEAPKSKKKLFDFLPKKANKDLFVSFENDSELGFFKNAPGTKSEITQSKATHGLNSLQVILEEKAEFPGLVWEVYGDQVQDWSKATHFYADIYNNTEDFIALEVKFKSGENYPKQSFSYPIQLEPLSANEIAVPLDVVGQTCDLTKMSYVKMFTRSPITNFTLYVDSVGTRKANEADGVAFEEQAGTESQKELKILKEGHEIFAAASLDRVFRDGKTLVKPSFTNSVELFSAKHEYESFQVVVHNGRTPLNNVRLKMSNLTHQETGFIIDQRDVSWRVIGYVPTKKPYYAVKYVGLWPDPLLPEESVTVQAGEAQPFWITIYVDEKTQAGTYQGSVEVWSDDKQLKTIPVSLTVYDFNLPKRSSFKTAFDFYSHEMKSRYPRKYDETEEEHRTRLEELSHKFILEMLKNRMSPVLNLNPKNEKELNNLEIYRHHGLTTFAVGRHTGTFGNNWPKTDEELEKLLPVYRGYAETLDMHGLLEDSYLYTWDEGKIGNPRVSKICSLVHRAHPKLRNLVCYHGYWDPEEHPEWGKDIDIWTFQIDKYDPKKMNKLKELGMEVWMYVSGPGSTGSPNLAMDFDSIDYRIIPWMSWKLDFEGFLYWCVNWWVYANPFETAANTKWDQNGNGLLFYPGEDGPISSLRAEIFRDGMEDYEYLVLLRDLIDTVQERGLADQYKDKYKEALRLLQVDNSIVKTTRKFTKNTQTLFKYRASIADLIEFFSKIVEQ